MFAAITCIVCAVIVSTAAVTLKERQEINQALSKKKNVLEAAGLMQNGEKLTEEEVMQRFSKVQAVLVDLATGQEVEGDTETFDQQRMKKDPNTSFSAPTNPSRVLRLPNQALIYKVLGASGEVEKVILPIEGYGLWGTLYGFIALGSDLNTIAGLTYYDHKETPGLGGEVDNPRWKALWPGRKTFDSQGVPAIKVVRGAAGPVSEAPHSIDGLSGATITSRGVTNMLSFWLGSDVFGKYLDTLRSTARSAA
jgi:Na+-transporting NADH:ubiquinone oxidoreductase subunit C